MPWQIITVTNIDVAIPTALNGITGRANARSDYPERRRGPSIAPRPLQHDDSGDRGPESPYARGRSMKQASGMKSHQVRKQGYQPNLERNPEGVALNHRAIEEAQ
jgi:hypothetical protein